VTCLPLAAGRIPPNRWYGVRLPASYTSKENWYRINRFGGYVFLFWGLVLALIGLIPLFYDWPRDQTQAILFLIIPMPTVMIPLLIVIIYAQKFDA